MRAETNVAEKTEANHISLLKLRRAAAYLRARSIFEEIDGLESAEQLVRKMADAVREAVRSGGSVEAVLSRFVEESGPEYDNYSYELRPFLERAIEELDQADEAVEVAGGTSIFLLADDVCDPFIGRPHLDNYSNDLEAFHVATGVAQNELKVLDPVGLRFVKLAALDQKLREKGRPYITPTPGDLEEEPHNAPEAAA